jgi:hypothetical protein
MKRFLNIVAMLVGVSLTLAMTAYAVANASKSGAMTGVVAAKSVASLEVMDQPGAKESVTVASVNVPGPSWIVVHLDVDGKPGKRIGLQAVPAGRSADVMVKLDAVTLTDKLIVAVHADRGIVGTFEFAMDNFDASPDKPYFVDGMELAMESKITIPPFGVNASAGEASIAAADQPGATDSIVVAKVVAPTGAWLVVHLDDKGMPGKRVGFVQVAKGTSTDVRVKLDPSIPLTDKLLIAVHADRGVAGTLEFDMMDKYNSPDQPFFVNGKEVATGIVVTTKPFGVIAAPGRAAIKVDSQPGAKGSLVIAKAVAPTGAWIVVHLDDGGMPGKRVGYGQIVAGTSTNVIVKLDPNVTLTDTLFVAIHADRGVAGTLEFDMMDKFNSPDQPFFVNGHEVATAVAVR